jgi:hypothetical protein
VPCVKFHQNLSKDKISNTASMEMCLKEELKTSDIVTGWMVGVQFQAEARDVALLCSFYPAAYPMGTGNSCGQGMR